MKTRITSNRPIKIGELVVAVNEFAPGAHRGDRFKVISIDYDGSVLVKDLAKDNTFRCTVTDIEVINKSRKDIEWQIKYYSKLLNNLKEQINFMNKYKLEEFDELKFVTDKILEEIDKNPEERLETITELINIYYDR